MKAEIKAIFDSKYQENGITIYINADKIDNIEKFSNPFNEKYNTIGITGFRDEWNRNWDKGMEVDFKLITQESKGRTYLNFRQPAKQDDLGTQKFEGMLTEIKVVVDTILKEIRTEEPAPKEPKNQDEIPF